MFYNGIAMGRSNFIWIAAGFIWLLGCQPTDSGDTAEARLDGTEQSTSVIPTITPSNTITPIPSESSIPSLTLTWEPVPTLPPDEALAAMLALYENNGGCELPCWWGGRAGGN